MTTNEMYRTNYRVAAHWLGNSLIMCNDIAQVDETLWENVRFSPYYYEDEDGNQYEDEDEIPEGAEYDEHMREIYQYFLTDCSEDDVKYLEGHFGLLFAYSEKLDLYVLCVDHYGTSWNYVGCDTDLEQAARKLGESK